MSQDESKKLSIEAVKEEYRYLFADWFTKKLNEKSIFSFLRRKYIYPNN